tara:strand:+ start:1614 stop:1994 length:381 start_codon:yes stop_codon:yes gene_type:complete
MSVTSKKDLIIPFLSLMTSFSTLICCALPALLVTIGAGAVLAGLISSVPQIILLSKYKTLVFSIAGLLIIIGGFFRWINRNAACPIDPIQARICMKIRAFSKWIYWSSVVLYFIGIFFAFIASKLI